MKQDLEVIDINTRSKKVSKDELEERRRRQSKLRARKLTIKRKRQRRIVWIIFAIIATIMGTIAFGKVDMGDMFAWFTGKSTMESDIGAVIEEGTQYVSYQLLYEVEYEDFFTENTPKVLSETEVYKRLEELSESYPELKEIYDRREEYPVKMLGSLCNNIEMHEFVKGYLKYAAGDTTVIAKAELSEAEKEQQYPLFLQWDKRWGYEPYGDSHIALAGCGPTTLAMVATAITGRDSYTPDVVARYSMNNGFYVEGTGTAWSLMTEGAEAFGLSAAEISLDEMVMKRELDAGKVIICSMRPGDFTSVGHFIMIYTYDENGFRVNDANSIFRSSRSWTYENLKSQIRILWSYGKK